MKTFKAQAGGSVLGAAISLLNYFFLGSKNEK
jgi:hypothetical protein